MNYDFIFIVNVHLPLPFALLFAFFVSQTFHIGSFINFLFFVLPQVHALAFPLGAFVSDELTFCSYS